MPTSEKKFIKITLPDISVWPAMLRRLQQVSSPFTPRQDLFTGKYYLYVPSFEIMQNYLRACGGEDAVLLAPAFHVSSPQDIRDDIPLRRHQTGLNLPGIESADIADTYYTGLYTFMVHDFHHAYIASSIPLQHRLAFHWLEGQLQKIIKETENLTEAQKKAAREEVWDLVDMEHLSYLREMLSEYHTKPRDTSKPEPKSSLSENTLSSCFTNSVMNRCPLLASSADFRTRTIQAIITASKEKSLLESGFASILLDLKAHLLTLSQLHDTRVTYLS